MGELFSDFSKWIWMERAPEVNCYLRFRQNFFQKAEEPLKLHISAEGQYAVYLNGEYIPSTQYPDYPFYKSVQVIPLQCARGQRKLEIDVLYSGRDTAVSRREVPGLRFELRQKEKLLAFSGSGTEVGLLDGYQSGEVPLVTPQMGFGFVYEDPGEILWENAEIAEKDCTFVPRPVLELEIGGRKKTRLLSQGVFTKHESGLSQYAGFHYRELSQLVRKKKSPDLSEKESSGFALAGLLSIPDAWFPAEAGVPLFSEEEDGIYLILDLGEETIGYLDLDLQCPAPAFAEISYGEHLEDLRVRSDVGGRHFTFRWEIPAERKCFIHRFHRLGGRYLQLLIFSHDVTVYYAGLRTVSYPLKKTAEFYCSDHLHNRIYQVAEHTLRCCLHEHYEDCPWREQALYAFDSRNQMLFGYYAFGEFQQPRASLKLLALSQREDGLLELCAPARVNVDIPAFSLMFLVELEEYCRYSGDVAFASEMLPVGARILEAVHARVKDGMVWNFQEPQYWNFYEWRPLLEGTPIERKENLPPSAEAPLQLFYLLALQRMKRLCAYLGKQPAQLDEAIRTAAEGLENFWDPEEGAYASFIREGRRVQYAQLVQSLALYTEAVPMDRRERLRERLAAGEFVPVSMASSIFRYDALLQEPEKYGTLVFEEVADKWGEMLYQGVTSFWETEMGAEDFERAGSLCHAWSSVPIYLYGAYLLGVRPEEPGKWRVFPGVPSSIFAARGKFFSPEGEKKVEI